MNFFYIFNNNITILLNNDILVCIVENISTIIPYNFDHVNFLHFIHDQFNKLIILKYELLTYIKDIYIYICDNNYYSKDLYLGILLKVLSYLGLIFLIIALKLLIFFFFNTLLNSDDESANIPNNEIVVSPRRKKNDTIVPPSINSGGSNPPPDSDNSFVEMATGILTLLWYSIKRDDIRQKGYTEEFAKSISEESAKDISAIISPADLPYSFTNSNEASILNRNFLYHVDNKHYNVLDYDRYNNDNVLHYQDVRKVYGSNSESVENILRDFLKSNSRMTPGMFDIEEPRPYTRDVWGAYITIDPPIIPDLGDPNPVIPWKGANLDDITDPYMHSAIKIITTEVYPPGVADIMSTKVTDYDVIDEKKLTDLKYIFLFYKSVGNADLNWEKAVECYALQYHKNPWQLTGQGEQFQTYMKMLDFVDMMHHTRNRSIQLK